MFKKLRTKLILINMILLTAVFLTIFSVIYINTKHDINKEIEMTLNGLMDGMHKPKPKVNNITIDIDKNNKVVKSFAPFGISKETFDKQKQFIADASHELKTPLTIINTNTSLILSTPEDTVKNQIKWLKYINICPK